MDEAGIARPLGWVIDIAAAAMFAGSIGFAALFAAELGTSAAAAAAAAAFALAASLLRRVPEERACLDLPAFMLAELDAPAPDDTLLLTADMAKPAISAAAAAADELLLDDVLAELEPNSRVVRLFDPARIATAGELQAKIERHLRTGSASVAPPDAALALSEALAELKRSLR